MRHPVFIALAPLGFFNYAGMIAIQTLWAGPWLTDVAGWTAGEAAQGLFAINLSMLGAFLAWGAFMPRLRSAGFDAHRLIAWGMPASLLMLAGIVIAGPRAGALSWASWCVLSTFVTSSQPAVGMAFPAASAGRALSAFNLVIFAGVFGLQWSIGLAVDAFIVTGSSRVAAFRMAIALFGLCCALAYGWFMVALWANADNRA